MDNTRKMLIAGNWKMNGSAEFTADLLARLLADCPDIEQAQWLVCPPFPYLSQAHQQLKGSHIQLGAQNVCQFESGAYTGEVSADMLRELGCEFAIVGHSERRHVYGESNELVADRFAMALQSGLSAILCVGETLEDRQADKTDAVVHAQLSAALNKVDADHMMNAVVAYEPVWAIGTGETATPQQAQDMHQKIREQLMKYDANVANSVRILYGGSVKPDNAAELFAMDDIDGALIGGASLKAEQFSAIGRLCNN